MKNFFIAIEPILPLSGVIIGSFISFFPTWYFARKTDNRTVRQTAAQLAQYLDTFAHSCAGTIADNDAYTRLDGYAGARRTSIPILEEFPNDTDLGLVEAVALSRLLSLRLKWKLAEAKIQFWWDEVGDHECMPTETDEQCGVLGSEALEIADMLRASAKLPKPRYEEFYWDFSNLLRETRELAITRLSDRKRSGLDE